VEVRKLDIALLGDEYRTACCCCCAVVTFEGANGPRRNGHADRYTLASVSVGESGGVAVPKRLRMKSRCRLRFGIRTRKGHKGLATSWL
jgi:hypothetical protein